MTSQLLVLSEHLLLQSCYMTTPKYMRLITHNQQRFTIMDAKTGMA